MMLTALIDIVVGVIAIYIEIGASCAIRIVEYLQVAASHIGNDSDGSVCIVIVKLAVIILWLASWSETLYYPVYIYRLPVLAIGTGSMLSSINCLRKFQVRYSEFFAISHAIAI